MSLAAFVPLIVSAFIWAAMWRINRGRDWFSIGELIFWAVIILIVIQLIWLRWF